MCSIYTRDLPYSFFSFNNIELDDKWITEKEDPFLPKMFHGWIYMNILLLKREFEARK